MGAGSLATFLAPALSAAGYEIAEIISRPRIPSLTRARQLARKVGARAVSFENAKLDATLVWFCVPDREIRGAASSIAKRKPSQLKYAFHSSGALLSGELEPFRRARIAVASVHPLMTFVPGAYPSLTGVPFALEGDPVATKLAARIVRDLHGESFPLPAHRKPAYHAWATMTSPLLLSYLVRLEDAARLAGLGRKDARRMSLPIIVQTLANYGALGPGASFSGPFIRGDASTVARHLALLKKSPATHAVYMALARAAVQSLPVKNQKQLRRLLSFCGRLIVRRKGNDLRCPMAPSVSAQRYDL